MTPGKEFSASMAPMPVPQPVMTKSAAPELSRIAASRPSWTGVVHHISGASAIQAPSGICNSEDFFIA
jgi:hypothetical protein